jgi:MFS family permease
MTTVPHKNRPVDEQKSGKTWQVGSLTYTAGGLAVVFCWLIWGDLAWAVRDRAVPPVMQLLFKKFGASDMVTGLIFSSLPAALGLFISPIVSYNSDRLRSRWGRRIPFLIGPVPFIVLSMIGLAFCPSLGQRFSQLLGPWSPGLNWSVVIIMGIFWTMFEVSHITSASVFGALINDVVPQEVIGRFYGLFRAASLITGIVFFYNLNNSAESHFAWIFLGIAALYGVGFSLMCLNVREGTYPPVTDSPAGTGAVFAVKTYFRDGFGNSYYLWFFAASTLCILSGVPFNLYSLFYAKSIGMDLGIYFKCLALTYVFSLLLSYPLGSLADRFHPLRVTMAAVAIYIFVMACGGLMVRDSTTFAIALVAHGVVFGSIATATASLGQRLLPRDRFAEIGSAGGIIVSVSSILLPPIVGTFLDHMNHAYRYTFFASAALSLLTLVAFFVVYRRFVALGGPNHYIAPK